LPAPLHIASAPQTGLSLIERRRFSLDSLERRRILAANVQHTADGVLLIEGTDASDQVVVRGHEDVLVVRVVDQFGATAYKFPAKEVTSIRFLGRAGHDYLSGWSGNDVLVGGNGDDQRYGHAGRDILIGGRGADDLDGVTDDDLVITGSLSSEHEVRNLRRMSAIRGVPDDSKTRVENLQLGRQGGIIGRGSAVEDDRSVNRVFRRKNELNYVLQDLSDISIDI